jgi:multiple sugar transport system permease protein
MKSLSTTQPAEELASPSGKRQGARKGRSLSRRNALTFWSFVLPLLLGITVFFYIPIIWSVVLSFSTARATLTPTAFIGFQNYISMLNDPYFTGSLGTFTIFAIFIVPTTFIGSLGLALLVNSIKFGRGFFRSVFFLPTACSYVLASIVWKMSIFNGIYYGLANTILALFGQPSVAWTSSATPPLYWVVLVTVRLWLQVGIYMIIFIAGLQDIPQELYEAAMVDGARKGWQTFRNITLPLLRNASIAVLLLNIIAAFQAFDEFYNIMSGGNSILARPPLVYLYTVALTNQDYGQGSAGAIILTIIIIVFTLIQGRFLGFGKAD